MVKLAFISTYYSYRYLCSRAKTAVFLSRHIVRNMNRFLIPLAPKMQIETKFSRLGPVQEQ